MATIGANPSQLDELARTLNDLAHQLEGKRLQLTGWIELDRFWRGRRADEFRHEWAHQYVPQITQAVNYLQGAVSELHRNANEQRVASGEQARDYGASSFVSRLFGDARNGVNTVARSVGHAVTGEFAEEARGVEHLWDNAYAGFAALGGSPVWQAAVADLTIVSDVAGMVALIPIPGVQEIAGGVALATGAAVLVGHLAEMANKGRFDTGEFATDSLGVVGGSLGELVNVPKLEDAVKTASDANILTTSIPTAKQLPQVVKALTSASAETKVVTTAIVGTRTASAIVDGYTATASVAAAHGQVLQTANASLGYVKAVGDLLGVKGQLVGSGAGTERDLNSLIAEGDRP